MVERRQFIFGRLCQPSPPSHSSDRPPAERSRDPELVCGNATSQPIEISSTHVHNVQHPSRRCHATQGTPTHISNLTPALTGLQITAALQPSTLEIHNDSSMHAHHQAMQGSVSKETHFRVLITSEAFKSKMQPARHRMVYALLKEELERTGGIHALQLRTRTPEEEERQIAREKAEQEEK